MKLDLDDIIHVQETTLTVRGSRRRTTIPGEILRYLKLGNGDRIRWVLLKDGTLSVTPAKEKKRRK